MALRDLLVYVDQSQGALVRLHLAADLAHRHASRLTAQHLEVASGAGTKPSSRPTGSEQRDSGANRPHCVSTHQLSGYLSLSAGALPGPPPTPISSKTRRR